MKNLFISLLIILITSCSDKDKTDQQLLNIDKKELLKNLDSDKVTTYKFGKILIRASAEKNTISPEFQSFKADMDRIFNKVIKYDIEHTESLSLLDYISMYRDYKKMKSFIIETDEDIFPTLSDAFNTIYGDSISKQTKYLEGNDKLYVQNIEHSILSAIVILSQDLGKEVALYECAKTKPELLPDSEIKTLLQFFRGFLFFEKQLYYLSEDEISRNINWLNHNKNVHLPYTKAMFGWGNLNNQQTHTGMHALNHLFRGFDRLMMEREIDEKRALNDFDIFLKDAQEIGLDNEIVWSIETYIHLKNNQNDKAITSLTKLKTSQLLSSTEKEKIDESIEYIKNRKSDQVLNRFYDKYFLSKIATKYMFSILSNIDWKKILEQQNVPHTEEIFKTIDNFKTILVNLEKYSNTENLKETGEEIKEKGLNIWNKTKELTE
ncbi:short-chain dehydrogenase [Flavobacterium sp. CBA20B-1]|uniref:short-chain dehydrogenase n=1 Tax=unclassified Flavobacterium TaxID=196869 RepID=UPI002224293B|nr:MULTISPECIES: short-chain dehydrogenase [unclassified Flavobacterium]WCM42687.1 short-chain dehydrogenase [Flavobacterium sp. CBA20B-1]